MNFIEKIFKQKIDESVHLQFQKFSRGEFTNRAVVRVKKSVKKTTINTSAEFANDLVKMMAEKLGNDKTQVTGAIVSTSDLTGELEFKDKKQFQGVKRYLIDKEMSGQDILNLLERFPKTFFALSFDIGEEKLKIKPKAPKSGKPGSKEEEKPKPDFCKLITTDQKIVDGFVFEKSDFKEADVNHKFIVEKIIMPEGEEDYAKIRELAKRQGKIIREAEIDEKPHNSEKEFVA